MGEGGLQIGPAAEEDQAQAIALTPLDEAASDRLDHRQPVGRTPVEEIVRLLHGAGDVHRQHQIAPGQGQADGLPQPLGAGGGQDQQPPGQPSQEQRQAALTRRNAEVLGLQGLERRQAQGGPRRRSRRG